MQSRARDIADHILPLSYLLSLEPVLLGPNLAISFLKLAFSDLNLALLNSKLASLGLSGPKTALSEPLISPLRPHISHLKLSQAMIWSSQAKNQHS